MDQPLVELLGSYAPIANLDDRKCALTVCDVLTMRTGMDWNEDSYPGSPLETLNNLRTDWIRFVVAMREQPGTRWQYNSGGVIALGGAVGIGGGMNTAEYARGTPLPPDRHHGRQVVSGIPDRLPSPRVPSPHRRTAGYGCLWWLYTLDGGPPNASTTDLVIAASGAQGQWLFIVPRHNLVVAINAGILSGPEQGSTFCFGRSFPRCGSRPIRRLAARIHVSGCASTAAGRARTSTMPATSTAR